MTETVTENAETVNADSTENPTPETEVTEPVIIKVPKSVEEAANQFPLAANAPAPLPFGILGQLIESIQTAADITNVLAANNQDLSAEEIVTLASQRSEEAIKVLYASYEKMRMSLEKKMKDIVDAMNPILSEGKLSEEEVAAKLVERKTVIEGVSSFKGSIEMLAHMIPEPERDQFLKVVSEMKVPGMRGSGKVTTSSASASGFGKPRLHGGKVKVQFGDSTELKEFANIPDAAKAIANQTNSPISGPDVLQAWCLSQSVSHWSDIAMGVTDFQFQPGVRVYIEKKSAE